MLGNEEAVTPIAGCTDVYVSLNFGTVKQTRFMNLWRLKELRGVDRRGGRLRIGALTTYTELIHSPLVARALPMLVSAAREIGGRQIQHRGTKTCRMCLRPVIGPKRYRNSDRRMPRSAIGTLLRKSSLAIRQS